MQPEAQIAFAAESHDPPALEIRVNFGIFAGREVTPAEIDELAKEIVPDVHEISIVSEQRHELSEDVEVSLHQVRIEVDTEHVPADAAARGELRDSLVATAERWANACIADRGVEVAEL